MKKLASIALAIVLTYGYGVRTAVAITPIPTLCVNCSTTFTQLLEHITGTLQLVNMYANYAESIIQTARQIDMVRQNVEQYENMVKNTNQLPRNMVSAVSRDLTELAYITNKLNTQRADINGMEQIFDNIYKSQDELGELAHTPNEKIRQQNYDDMSRRIDDATLATFQLTGQQLKDLEQSGQTETYVNSLLSTPEGQMQAIMAGNQLTALQLTEARQTRELMATRTQAELASQMKREKESQLSEETARKVMNMHTLDTTPHDDPF